MDIHFFNDEDIIDEEKYLRTCKRSILYQWALEERKNISKDIHCLKREKNQEENLYFSERFLNYLLNNMIGLTPLWCNALLGDMILEDMVMVKHISIGLITLVNGNV